MNLRTDEAERRDKFIDKHPDLSSKDLARKMKQEGLYSPKTALIDIVGRVATRRIKCMSRRDLHQMLNNASTASLTHPKVEGGG